MPATSELVPVTEILYLDIEREKDLKIENSEAGKSWARMLELARSSLGFQKLYWGRALEHPDKVRLHIVRQTLSQHQDFQASEGGREFSSLLSRLVRTGTEPVIRHVLLQDTVPQNGIAHEAPLTGSAIYVNSNEVYSDYAWPLWTHIVRHAQGNRGVAGGRVIGSEDGKEAYLVYVGWETNDHHQAFRKSPACADRRVILTLGNDGQHEYYHIVFEK